MFHSSAPKRALIHVRHNPRNSVVAHVEVVEQRMLRLLRVTPDQGLLPSTDDLIGRVFGGRKPLRQVLVDRMRRKHN